MLSASPPNRNGTNVRPSSVVINDCMTADRSMPPYSSGVDSPQKPNFFAFNWRSRCSSRVRPGSPFRSRRSTSFSRLTTSFVTKPRAVSRIAFCSSESEKSTMTPSVPGPGGIRTCASPRPRTRGAAPSAARRVWLRDVVDAGFLALLGRDRRRGPGQRVEAPAGLREGDDVADRVRRRTAARRCGPSRRRSRRAAGRRRRTRRAGSRTSPAPPPPSDAHHLEHPLLDVGAVDTDRAATDLVAVAHDVVGVGERRGGIGVERFRATPASAT